MAIAADSAVTIGGPGSKIYNTANKLFALSTVEPVAMMIYGADAFGTIPWETIVKEYRHELAPTSYATVEEHASKFFEYIASLVVNIPAKKQREQGLVKAQWELGMLRDAVMEFLEQAELIGSTLGEREIQIELARLIEARIDDLKLYEPVEGLNASIAGRQINTMIQDWSNFVGQSLVGLPINNEIIRRARIMVRSSLRVVSRSPLFSGVVVTGFGRDQWFPAISHRLIDGIVAKRALNTILENVQIDEGPPAFIRAFAQGDMVATFMDGLHPTYRAALDRYRVAMGHFFDEVITSLIKYIEDRFEVSLSTRERSSLVNQMIQMRVEGFEELGDPIRSYYEPIPCSDYVCCEVAAQRRTC